MVTAVHSHPVDTRQVVGSHLAVDIHQVVGSPVVDTPAVDSRLAAHMGVAPRQVCPVGVEHNRRTGRVDWGLAPG